MMFLIIKIKWDPRTRVTMRIKLSDVKKAVRMRAGIKGSPPVTFTG